MLVEINSSKFQETFKITFYKKLEDETKYETAFFNLIIKKVNNDLNIDAITTAHQKFNDGMTNTLEGQLNQWWWLPGEWRNSRKGSINMKKKLMLLLVSNQTLKYLSMKTNKHIRSTYQKNGFKDYTKLLLPQLLTK